MPDEPQTISAAVFRITTAEVLDRAERGEPTIITRNSVPVAVVISYQDWLRLRKDEQV